MKNYTITVNGTVYEVCVEESEGAGAAAAAAPKQTAAPKKAAPKKAAAPAGAQGSVKIASPMPGKILKTNLAAGAAVKKGDVVLILEAMKMENEIVAPQDGTLASVNVTVGQSVEAGEVLATMN